MCSAYMSNDTMPNHPLLRMAAYTKMMLGVGDSCMDFDFQRLKPLTLKLTLTLTLTLTLILTLTLTLSLTDDSFYVRPDLAIGFATHLLSKSGYTHAVPTDTWNVLLYQVGLYLNLYLYICGMPLNTPPSF